MASIGGTGVAPKRDGNGGGAISDSSGKPTKNGMGVVSSKIAVKGKNLKPIKHVPGNIDNDVDEKVPEAIRSALLSPDLRILVLQWERELLRYVKSAGNNSSKTLVISSLRLTNLYHRLLVHQICQFVNLSHSNTPKKDIVVSQVQGMDYTGFINSKGSLFETILPPARPPSKPEPKPRKPMLKRREKSPSTPVSDILLAMTGLSLSREPQSSDASIHLARASKEAEYQKARDAIFESLDGEDDEEDDPIDSNDIDNSKDYRPDRQDFVPFQQQYGFSPYSPLQSPCSLAGYPLDIYGPGYGLASPMYASPGKFHLDREPIPVPIQYGMYYDAETQRRLLNNPYIVVPNAEATQTSPWLPRQL